VQIPANVETAIKHMVEDGMASIIYEPKADGTLEKRLVLKTGDRQRVFVFEEEGLRRIA